MLPTETSPHINVGPPAVDYTSLFGTLYHNFIELYPSFFVVAKNVVGVLIGISFPVALFFLIAIVYCVEQLKLIRKKEEEIFDTKVEPAYQEAAQGDSALTSRWERVKSHLDSHNQNDWKQAILEADIMLDEILTSMGYRGESVGEKLKRVNPGDMKSLNEAWEAHKIRNMIAHEPGFVLGHHEAKAAIASYRTVFDEFYYI
ncbi:MAG: hypothetical protein AAB365_02830 [Patescibacteria group bacterium]